MFSSNIKMYGKFLKITNNDTAVLTVIPVIGWLELYGEFVPAFYVEGLTHLHYHDSQVIAEKYGKLDSLFSEQNYDTQKLMLMKWQSEYLIGLYRYVNWL